MATNTTPTGDGDNNDEVYAQVEVLFLDLIKEANYILKAGTTQNKIALMRSVIPALMKELNAREDAKAKSEQHDALVDLFQQARSTIKPRVVVADGPDTIR